MMRSSILITALLLGSHAGAECTICSRTDDLVAKWAAADSKEKRGVAMRESYDLLAEMEPKFEARSGAPNAADVAAVARLIGAIYARDYDPRKDILRLYRKLMANPAFAKDFEDELARLPAGQGEKIKQGLRVLPNFD